MKVSKPQSKRQSTKLRAGIAKASAAKQRKNRKEAKKNPQWKSRVKKDPGVPNLFPYKGKILAELEEGRRRKEEEGRAKREVEKARRAGGTVEGVVTGGEVGADEEGDEELMDEASDDEGEEVTEVEMDGAEDDDGAASSNPMAALVASAQARASTYKRPAPGTTPRDDDVSDSESDSDAAAPTHAAKGTQPKTQPARTPAPGAAPRAPALPSAALDDPVKAVTLYLDTQAQALPALQSHYGIPPLVTAGSDVPTRFLVEVARKRGRLGRGGVPNTHAAALVVVADLHEKRVAGCEGVGLAEVLDAGVGRGEGVSARGEVRVVEGAGKAPMRIEGLFGEGEGEGKKGKARAKGKGMRRAADVDAMVEG